MVVGRAHLNLLVLEDSVDAAVEGRPREHGRDGVREVQHRLQHRSHALGERRAGWGQKESLRVTNKVVAKDADYISGKLGIRVTSQEV